MTQIQKNIVKSSVVIMLLFLVLVIAFLVNLLNLSDKLVNSPYNKRLNELRATTEIGSIYDTNNVLLAGSEDGQRTYHNNSTMRIVNSHLIGDTYGYCPTGAEIRFGSILLDYRESMFSIITRQIKDAPRAGDDIQLTVDCRLNVFAYDKIEDYSGAVVIQDYTTGEILCMVSSPAFDPQTLLEDLSVNMEKDAFVNRAIQGQYAPGSIFHIVTAGAAIEYLDDVENTKFNCDGSYKVDDENIYCDNGHGYITLDEAFSQSCNTVFAELGVELGANKIKSFAKQLKFNYNFDYFDVALYPSSVTVAKSEEDAAFAYAAIGQHEDIVSPMHMSMIAGAIANDGIMMTPILLKSIDNQLVSKSKHGTRMVSEDTAQTLQSYMAHNVAYGSGNDAESDTIKICGKDGTAISSTDESLYPNCWFVGYIDDEEHPLTISIVLEQSYVDSNVAVPIGKSILEYAYSIGY